MAGAAPTPTSSGGRKSVNAELNLIPFIDLFSVLISFLLITAVWTQIARINVDNKVGTGAGQGQKPPDDVQLAVTIGEGGFLVSEATLIRTPDGQIVPDERKIEVPKRGGQLDFEELARKLREMRSKYPAKGDILVRSQDKIPYKDLIGTMDICLANEFKSISVAGAPSS
jgi:biopolymer transport protein ExbD